MGLSSPFSRLVCSFPWMWSSPTSPVGIDFYSMHLQLYNHQDKLKFIRLHRKLDLVLEFCFSQKETMAVGEIFLSAAFQITLEKLASPMSKELEKRFGDLKKLTRTLSKIQAVLSDAEARQITNAAVKLWLGDVEEVAYDAEDVLEEVMTEASRLKLQNPVSYLSSLSRDFQLEIRSKLEKINERLDEIEKERDGLGLREISGEKRNNKRPQSSSLVEESRVLGREVEKEEIVELLVSDEYG